VNPGATVIQTRSAFVQRDGDIVDIDGVSPVYFNNVDAGANYTIAIRHRNHLGIATDPVANLQSLSEATPGTTTDFTTMTDAQIFGTSAAFTTSAGKVLLWGGNINANGNTRYQGAGNDRAVLLTDVGGNELSVLTNVYNRSDINMNRTVRYQGAANDRAFLLSTVLGSAELTVRTQALPL